MPPNVLEVASVETQGLKVLGPSPIWLAEKVPPKRPTLPRASIISTPSCSTVRNGATFFCPTVIMLCPPVLGMLAPYLAPGPDLGGGAQPAWEKTRKHRKTTVQ